MNPGRELDVLVVEKVMGWKRISVNSFGLTWMWDKKEGCLAKEAQECPKYSTDIAAAWEVVEKLTNIEKGCGYNPQFELQYQEKNCDEMEWSASFYDRFGKTQWPSKDLHIAYADTVPHVICLAALKAVGVNCD